MRPEEVEDNLNSRQRFTVFYGYQFAARHCDPELLQTTLTKACDQAAEELRQRHAVQVTIEAKRFQPAPGGILLGDLQESIQSSVMCVFEVSDKNPNVFLEAGYAMAQKKRVVLLIDSEVQHEIPSDVKGLTYVPYDRNNLEKSLMEELPSVVADEVWRYIALRPLRQWFWEPIVSSPAKVFLGRTAEENFSWGDVFALNTIRTHLQQQEMLELNLEPGIKGDVFGANVMCIGGPRRNPISERIFEMIKDSARFRFVDLEDEERDVLRDVDPGTVIDPYVIYDTRTEERHESQVNFSVQRPQRTTGKDFALVYRITNPYIPAIRWLVFAGISRAGTLACFQAMMDSKTLSQIRKRLKADDSDIEVLFETQIVEGRSIGSKPRKVETFRWKENEG